MRYTFNVVLKGLSCLNEIEVYCCCVRTERFAVI